ncbi:hypothetical protein E2C01_091768 [Portunus trituberculatus]|uniref:Uncharacterized protein n=1 Tax=Portunus trituberculatus TaxID=210409 RepID=A0A5B7JPJ1_PORTR|nr:hypothetical protein [Portunus trituberculatus]
MTWVRNYGITDTVKRGKQSSKSGSDLNKCTLSDRRDTVESCVLWRPRGSLSAQVRILSTVP